MSSRRFPVSLELTLAATLVCAGLESADWVAAPKPTSRTETADATVYAPDLVPLLQAAPEELRDIVERFREDRSALTRRYRTEGSPERIERLSGFYAGWQQRLSRIDFDALGSDGRVDALLLRNRIDRDLELLKREQQRAAEIAVLAPFLPVVHELDGGLGRLEPTQPVPAASALTGLAAEIDRMTAAVQAGAKKDAGKDAFKTTKGAAFRAAEYLKRMKPVLEQWYKFHAGYDPLFSWWTKEPYKKVEAFLATYIKTLRETVVGIKEGEDDPIVGDPIGREALVKDLAFEMIPYSPEDLIAIGEREYRFCEAEMIKASREMGLGDDWKAALERVKNDHVEPGRQPELVRDLALEAIRFLDDRNLVTIPPLARDVWRMEMISPEEQKVSPFFLGGEVIQVSFPTDAMAHPDKLMSLRGNNKHFARATVQHELIPGHHLAGFMNDRFRSYRQAFGTPFWGEGWPLYWEMLLWDLGFPRSPEERIGMLFWRMHRAARIIFSFKFHLGQMTPQEAIDFLVDRVGHERANATGEVRRSFTSSHFGPLYQAAYMIGGLQFRALRAELVDTGRMNDREFHDAILRGNQMPVELVRARLTGQTIPREFTPQWKFAADKPGPNK